LKREEFNWLVDSIFIVKEEEILCSEYFAQLPRYVDLEIAEQDPAALLPEVHHHKHQCPECEEMYQVLLEAVSTQADNNTK
jgi:hypothetical protein